MLDPETLADWPESRPAHFAHNCTILQTDTWMCEDCGEMFERDPFLGDFPEDAIIEGECEITLDQNEWEAFQRWGMDYELGGEA